MATNNPQQNQNPNQPPVQRRKSVFPSWAELNPFQNRDQPPQNNNNTQNFNPDNTNNNNENKNNENKNNNNNNNPGNDPMTNFETLWQPNVDDKGQPIQPNNNQNTGYLPQIDPKKLGEMVGKMNFASDFTPEELDAVKAGGDGAVNALVSMMNKVGRRAFSHSLAAGNRIVEQGFSTAKDRFFSEVPDHVRDLMTENELSGSVTILQNPAFAPLVASVKQQYLSKFPKATPREVQAAVKSYFDHLGSQLNQTKSRTKQRDTNTDRLKRGDENADFLDWISSEIGSNQSPFANSGTAEDDDQIQN